MPPTVLASDEEEWIVSVDWETGTLSITGDVDLAASRGQANRVCALMDAFVRISPPEIRLGRSRRPLPGWPRQRRSRVRHSLDLLVQLLRIRISLEARRKVLQQAPFESVHVFGDIGGRCLTGAAPGTVDRERILDLTNYFAAASMTSVDYGR
jgi:hypothetical protein